MHETCQCRYREFSFYKKCSIHFNEITAIVGENNAGKSAVLRALNSFFNYEFEEPYFINATHRYDVRTVTKIILTFEDVPIKEIYKEKLINDQLVMQFSYAYSRTTKGRSIYCLTQSGKINAEGMLSRVELTFTDDVIEMIALLELLHDYCNIIACSVVKLDSVISFLLNRYSDELFEKVINAKEYPFSVATMLQKKLAEKKISNCCIEINYKVHDCAISWL